MRWNSSTRSPRSRITARPVRERRRRPRLEMEGLERRIVLSSSNPNAIATVGVYDENAVNANTVDFVATGSSLTNGQFAADMASAFSRGQGGVIDGSVLGAYYSYGTSQSKVLMVNSPTSWGIGQGPAISGTGSFSTTYPNYNTFSLNFGSIANGTPGEQVREIGITAMSYGEDYGNVTVTANLANGGTLSATRHIKEATGQGDTFYGLAAPSGDAITGFTLHFDGAPSPYFNMWFDDIGFITSPPSLVAVGDTYQASKNTALAVPASSGVLANDVDQVGGTPAATLVGDPTNGSVTLNPDGSFSYTPAAGFLGADSFTYRVNDGGLSSSPGTVTIDVTGPDDPPAAVSDSYSVSEGSFVSRAAATGVLANDSDPNGQPLTAALVSGPSHGSLTLNPDGAFIYTPVTSFYGTDSFTYKANDGTLDSNVATVTLNVSYVNLAPVAVNDSYNVAKGSTLTVSGGASTGALLRYGFDDASSSGTAPAEDSGAAPAAQGTFIGGASRTASTPGAGSTAALDLTAPGSDLVSAGHVAKLDNLPALTITGWLNLRGTPNDQDILVSDAPTPSSPAGEGGWDLRITSPFTNTDPISAGNFALQFEVDQAQGGSVGGTGGGSGTLNADARWVFFAVTYDTQGLMTFYTGDAAQAVAQSGYQQAVQRPLGANTAPFEVGGTASSTMTDYTPPAWLDDVRVYNAALSAAQLDQVRTQALGSGVLANDSDPNGDPLSAVLVNGPSHGSLTLGTDGSFTYTPNGAYLGTDSFTYRASDGTLTSGTATVTLNVTGADDPPVAVDDAYSVTQDTKLAPAASVLANDSDPNGQAITAVLLTQPAHGGVALTSAGYLVYTPNPGYTGTDSFTYKANDGTLDSNVATVTITVNPVVGSITGFLWNDANGNGLFDGTTAPESKLSGRTVFLDQNQNGVLDNGETSTTTGGDGSYTFSNLPVGTYYVAEVLPAGWKQTAPGGTGASNPPRVVTIGGSQPYVFDFNELASTTDQTIGPYHKSGFTFDTTVTQSTKFRVYGSSNSTSYAGSPALDTQWVPVTISLKKDDGSAFSVTSIDLSPNWTSVYSPRVVFTGTRADGTTVTQTIQLGNTLGFKTFALNGFTNIVSLTWPSSDPSNEAEFDNVNVQVAAPLNVSGINFGSQQQSPVAVADAYDVTKATALTVPASSGVLANDSDPAGLALTANLVSGPLHGSVTLNPDGSFTYTPSGAYLGKDSFTYKASDGVQSANATVSLNVTGPDDPPVAANDTYSVPGSSTGTVGYQGISVLANDSDPNGQALTAILVAGPSHGTLNLAANGSFTYTPAANFYGADSFTYQASDGTLASNVVSVTLNVYSVPQAVSESYAADENRPLTVAAPGVLANDTNASGQPITVAPGATVSRGTLAMNADGSFVYTPPTNFYGTVTLTYRITDGTHFSNFVNDTLTVNHVNQPPVAADDAYTVTQGSSLTTVVATSSIQGTSGAVFSYGPNDGTYSTYLQYGYGATLQFSPKANPGNTYTFTFSAPDRGPLKPGTYLNATRFPFQAAGTPGMWITIGSYGPNTMTGQFTIYDAQYDAAGNLTALSADYKAYPDNSSTAWVGHVQYRSGNGQPVGALTNDSDPDNDPLTAALVSGPAHGALTLNGDGSFTYTPVPSFNGTDSFTYKANDGALDSNVATVTLNVAYANLPPTAVADSYNTNENDTLVIPAPTGLLANDTDPNGDPLTASLASEPAHGTVAVNADGSFTYTPATDFSGIDSFTYYASDGTHNSNSATVTLTVSHVNQPPVAIDDAYSTLEDATLTITAPGVLGDDSDPDGDPLTAVVATNPSHGTLTLNADGSFTYTPNSYYHGTDSLTYEAYDGQAYSSPATVTITVMPVNHPPVATNDAYSTDENTSLAVASPGVLGNDTDPDNDPLTAALVAGPTHGTLTLKSDGSFTYTPGTNYFGTDSFTYRASDGITTSGVATVTLTINHVNQPPVAKDDSYSLRENWSIGVGAPGVLGNDTDPDNDPLTAVLVSNVSHGTLTFNANGSFSYAPAANYYGTDSFTYEASDGALRSAPSTVTFSVVHVNQPPTANPDSYTVRENYTIGVSNPGVLSNDTDPNGEPLTAVLVSGPTHGVLSFNSNGNGGFTYAPAANFYGTDSFTYAATNGTLTSAPATVTISVTHLDQPPTATDDSYSINENWSIGVGAPGVLANDTDPNLEALSAVLATNPAHGTVTLNANGSFTYVPATNYYGTDSFTYQASDGTLSSNIATVTLTINHVNQPPVASGQTVSTDENTAAAVALGATDPDNDPLAYTVLTNPAHGTLSGTAPNLIYTPATNYYGTDSFTFKANDGQLDSNIATVSIAVAYVNQPPAGTADSYATNENSALNVASAGVLANDTDPDHDPLTAVLVTGPAHGALSFNANGSFVYTPATNYYGSDTFTYKPFDGALFGNATTVTLTVNHVNQPPVAVNDAYKMAKNGTLSVAAPGILANDTDPDGNALKVVLVSNVGHGTLTPNANGSFTYRPKKNFTGTDQFTYRASDGSLLSNVATVTLTVSTSGTASVTAPAASASSPDPLAVTDMVLASLASLGTDPATETGSNTGAASASSMFIMPDVSVLEEIAVTGLNGKQGKPGLVSAGA